MPKKKLGSKKFSWKKLTQIFSTKKKMLKKITIMDEILRVLFTAISVYEHWYNTHTIVINGGVVIGMNAKKAGGLGAACPQRGSRGRAPDGALGAEPPSLKKSRRNTCLHPCARGQSIAKRLRGVPNFSIRMTTIRTCNKGSHPVVPGRHEIWVRV